MNTRRVLRKVAVLVATANDTHRNVRRIGTSTQWFRGYSFGRRRLLRTLVRLMAEDMTGAEKAQLAKEIRTYRAYRHLRPDFEL